MASVMKVGSFFPSNLLAFMLQHSAKYPTEYFLLHLQSTTHQEKINTSRSILSFSRTTTSISEEILDIVVVTTGAILVLQATSDNKSKPVDQIPLELKENIPLSRIDHSEIVDGRYVFNVKVQSNDESASLSISSSDLVQIRLPASISTSHSGLLNQAIIMAKKHL
jgi:hypothetical protein